METARGARAEEHRSELTQHRPRGGGPTSGPQGLALVSSDTIVTLIAGVESGIERLDALVSGLASSNLRQWALEDVSRSSSDSAVASAKREIDDRNAYRTRCIGELDELFSILVLDPTAPPVTESPGSVIDRLTVLSIRLAVLSEASSGTAVEASLAKVRIQHDQLLLAFDALLLDLRAGARSFLSLPTVKVYRSSEAEPS